MHRFSFPRFLIFPTALALVLLPGCAAGPDTETLKTFVEAQEAFDKAEQAPAPEQNEAFRRVALMYQGLIDRGVRSAPIYYNMGNAWARCNETGRAVAAYQLARRYRPLDPYIAENRRAVLGGAEPAESPASLIEHLFFWQDWVGCRQKMYASVFLAGLTFSVGVVLLFMRHRRLRRLFWASLVLTAIASLSVGYDWHRFEGVRHAVVASDQANPRKGNSEQYDLAFTTPVPIGTTATVIGRRGDWVQLRFGASRDGWLRQDQIVEY